MCALRDVYTSSGKSLCYGSKKSVHSSRWQSSKNSKKLRVLKYRNLDNDKQEMLRTHFKELSKQFYCSDAMLGNDSFLCMFCYSRPLKTMLCKDSYNSSQVKQSPLNDLSQGKQISEGMGGTTVNVTHSNILQEHPDVLQNDQKTECKTSESTTTPNSSVTLGRDFQKLCVSLGNVRRSRENWKRKCKEAKQSFQNLACKYEETITQLNCELENNKFIAKKLESEKSELEKTLANTDRNYEVLLTQHEHAVEEFSAILEDTAEVPTKKPTKSEKVNISFIETKVGKRYTVLSIEKIQHVINKYNLSGNYIRELFYDMLSEFTNLSLEEVKKRVPIPGKSQQSVHSEIIAEAKKSLTSKKVKENNFFAVEVDEGTVGREKYFDVNVLFQDSETGGPSRQFLGLPPAQRS